jgi:hypothetical protein
MRPWRRLDPHVVDAIKHGGTYGSDGEVYGLLEGGISPVMVDLRVSSVGTTHEGTAMVRADGCEGGTCIVCAALWDISCH